MDFALHFLATISFQAILWKVHAEREELGPMSIITWEGEPRNKTYMGDSLSYPLSSLVFTRIVFYFSPSQDQESIHQWILNSSLSTLSCHTS